MMEATRGKNGSPKQDRLQGQGTCERISTRTK